MNRKEFSDNMKKTNEQEQEKGCAKFVFAFAILVTLAAICLMYLYLQTGGTHAPSTAGAEWIIFSIPT